MSSNSVAIEFRGAGFSYAAAKGAASAHGVSFAQREGECVVVTGPSGCGKTTLARMVNGLIPAVYAGTTEGGVYVFGRAVADWEMDDLSCAVGSVFQNPRSQFFNLDTTSEIAFGCENMGVPRDEIARRIASATRALGENICSNATSGRSQEARSSSSPSPRSTPWSPPRSCSTNPPPRSTCAR